MLSNCTCKLHNQNHFWKHFSIVHVHCLFITLQTTPVVLNFQTILVLWVSAVLNRATRLCLLAMQLYEAFSDHEYFIGSALHISCITYRIRQLRQLGLGLYMI